MTTQSDKPIARAGTRELAEAGPNPQGKGQIGFLLDWAYSSPRGVVAKPRSQILADYFTSVLVLSSSFKFKPVFGKEYYLYLDGDRWSLSLISPDEWNDEAKQNAFVGSCVLHDDSTWSIAPSENIGKNCPVEDQLTAFYEGFVEKLRSNQLLEEGLPVYEANLPYYQRLFAAALSLSLHGSLHLGDQLGRSAQDWLESMPRNADRLLLEPE